MEWLPEQNFRSHEKCFSLSYCCFYKIESGANILLILDSLFYCHCRLVLCCCCCMFVSIVRCWTDYWRRDVCLVEDIYFEGFCAMDWSAETSDLIVWSFVNWSKPATVKVYHGGVSVIAFAFLWRSCYYHVDCSYVLSFNLCIWTLISIVRN